MTGSLFDLGDKSRLHTYCNMKPWRLGICLWTLPHPHGSQFSFVIGRDRIESGESHLALSGLERIIHDLANGHCRSIRRDHAPSTPTNFLSLSQQLSHRHQLEITSTISPKIHSTFTIPIVTAPENFLQIFVTSRTLRSTKADNVHYDVRPHARWIIMSEFYDGTSRPKSQS